MTWCAPPATPRLTRLKSWPCLSLGFVTTSSGVSCWRMKTFTLTWKTSGIFGVIKSNCLLCQRIWIIFFESFACVWQMIAGTFTWNWVILMKKHITVISLSYEILHLYVTQTVIIIMTCKNKKILRSESFLTIQLCSDVFCCPVRNLKSCPKFGYEDVNL